MTDVVIAVDLGGTRLRVAQLDTHLNIIKRNETLTKAYEGFDATMQRIKDAIRNILPEDTATVLGIGMSAPGPTNAEAGVVVAPPNLPGWKDVPLADIIQQEFDLPVYIGNDANVAALAEVAIGAASGCRHAIYLTISTGVGSGIINNGRLVLGQTGLGGEAGHMPILLENGHVSTVEKESAGPALTRQAREHIQAGHKTTITEMCNNDLRDIDAKMIGEAANNGDEVAIDIVKHSGKIMGLGITSLLHLFNPEKIVIGGGVSYIGDLLFDEINKTVRENVLDDEYWKNTPIIPSEISEDVSLYGSAMLVLTKGGTKDMSKVIRKQGIEHYQADDE